MGFQLFEKKSHAPEHPPELTIRKNGTFALSKAAYALAGSPRYIQLYFDTDARKIGIKPCDGKAPYAYRLHSKELNSKKRANPTVAVKAFCRENNINTDAPRVYEVSKENGMLVADLNSQWREPRVTIGASKKDKSTPRSTVESTTNVLTVNVPPGSTYLCKNADRCVKFDEDTGYIGITRRPNTLCVDCRNRAGI